MVHSSEKMFFTTSDLLNQINEVIHDNNPDDVMEGDEESETISDMNKSNDRTRGKAGFELQKRLPDGSTRKADENDVAVADFQSKMKQTVDRLQNLSPPEKLEWAKEQRQRGNQLYSRKEYKEAIDVYLTCLIAIDTNRNYSTPSVLEEEEEEEDNEWIQRIENEIKLPVLMNISACSLKLGMHRKTCSFCNMAIEIKAGSTHPKVYFRRGKSHMLLGLYTRAKFDFEKCLQLLDNNDDDKSMNDKQLLSRNNNEKDAIQKELTTLYQLMDAAKKNKMRQKEAMQRILGGKTSISMRNSNDNDEKITKSIKSKNDDDNDGDDYGDGDGSYSNNDYNDNNMNGLYSDLSDKTIQREYSTLRARKKRISKKKSSESIHHQLQKQEEERIDSPNYFIWYLKMVEYSLRKVLHFLGDEDALTRPYYDEDDSMHVADEDAQMFDDMEGKVKLK